MKIQKYVKNATPKLLVILLLFLVSCSTTANTTNTIANKPPEVIKEKSYAQDLMISTEQNGTIVWETTYPNIVSISEHEKNLYLLCKNKIVVLKNDGTYLKEFPIIYEENLELVDGMFLWDLNEVYCTFDIDDHSSTLTLCYDVETGQKKFQFSGFHVLSLFQMTNHDLCISDDINLQDLGKINAYNRLSGELAWKEVTGSYIISKVWNEEYIFCTFSSQTDEHTMYISSIRISDGTVVDNQILSSEVVSSWPDYVTRMCIQENTLYVTCVNDNKTILKQYNVLNDGKLELSTSTFIENRGIENHASVNIDEIVVLNQSLYLMTKPADYSGIAERKFLFNQIELQEYSIQKDRIEYIKSQRLFKTEDNIEGNIIDNVYLSSNKNTVFIDYHMIEQDQNLYQTINIHSDGSSKTDNLVIDDVSSVKFINDTLFIVSFEKDDNKVKIYSINSDGNSYFQYPVNFDNQPNKQYYDIDTQLRFIDIVPLDNGIILLVIEKRKFCVFNLIPRVLHKTVQTKYATLYLGSQHYFGQFVKHYYVKHSSAVNLEIVLD
ncbi:MAG: hypothetical protein KAH01_04520 [Caldisericia bacterium]|nr:hypothetical protein [Caldisericia bacterium]